LLPRNYPLLRGGTESPKVHLVTSQTKLHCRPTELYLGAATSRQQLHINVFWDDNVYDEATVKEWLVEIREAVKFYLASEVISTGEIRARL
jgi:hypothetical protein